MSMVTSEILIRLLLVTVGAYFFLFIFWKNFKDELEERSIFAHGLIILLTTCVTSIAFARASLLLQDTRIFEPQGLWLWGGFVGFLVSSTFTWYFSPFAAHYLLEIIVPSALLWLIFIGAATQLSISALSLLCLLTFLALKKKYKRFHWYRSGKVGFAALVTLTLFFLVKAIIAVVAPTMISSIGQVEVLLSISVVFVSVFSLYHLAQP